MAKVLVSIDDDLLRRVDRRAQELGLTRSAFVARLATEHVHGASSRPGPAARRSVERAREVCAQHGKPSDDSTALIRQMRDER